MANSATDLSFRFPLLQRQHWRLDVSVRGTAWRFDYLQRLRP